MKALKLALALAIVAAVVVVAAGRLAHLRPRTTYTGIPVGDLALGQPRPSIGLISPFPAWAPLPDRGLVTGAEVLAPQPPWGASAVAVVKIDDDVDHFMAGYRRRLAASGFRVRRLAPPVGPLFDTPEAQFQSDDGQGGHVIYITFRGNSAVRFVQLTYWSAPAPPLAR